MSRIGKQPVAVPAGVKVNVSGGRVQVEGKLGKNAFAIPAGISVAVEGNQAVVKRSSEEKHVRACHGLTRALLANAVNGVTTGFVKEMDIEGVGYRAAMQGKTLNLTLGFSHPVNYPAPEGITIETPAPTKIVVKGADKQKVGQVAAEIRKIKPPEPFKGKGVRYSGERVRRKAGKAGGK